MHVDDCLGLAFHPRPSDPDVVQMEVKMRRQLFWVPLLSGVATMLLGLGLQGVVQGVPFWVLLAAALAAAALSALLVPKGSPSRGGSGGDAVASGDGSARGGKGGNAGRGPGGDGGNATASGKGSVAIGGDGGRG